MPTIEVDREVLHQLARRALPDEYGEEPQSMSNDRVRSTARRIAEATAVSGGPAKIEV